MRLNSTYRMSNIRNKNGMKQSRLSVISMIGRTIFCRQTYLIIIL